MGHFIAVGKCKGRISMPITRRGPFSGAKHDDPQSEGVDRAGLKRSFPSKTRAGRPIRPARCSPRSCAPVGPRDRPLSAVRGSPCVRRDKRRCWTTRAASRPSYRQECHTPEQIIFCAEVGLIWGARGLSHFRIASHATDIQDRDGGALVMAMLSGLFPFRGKIYADGGYQGGKSQAAVERVINQINVKIVKRADAVKGFLVLPKRWVVERTLAWLNRYRRLAKDWERLNRRARGFLLLASVSLRVRRLGRNTK